MDKYEYKIRSEEIKTLIAKGSYVEAASIADTIDWRRVKSVMMLCTISDLYKMTRRFEDAKNILLLAYDRHPGGRSIVYSLCELSIKMEDIVDALEYYKEFVQVAPKDSGRYVLQYKLYEAQEVSLEERIAVLEELKSKDYSEKWAYELAYLYHRVGLGTQSVEECDELILWFGEGKYVLKALELKQLHEPLTASQQEKFDLMKDGRAAKAASSKIVHAQDAKEQTYAASEEHTPEETKRIPQDDVDIQVKLMKVGQYDTINMQKELAANMRELWEGPSPEEIENAEKEQAVGPFMPPEAMEMAEELDPTTKAIVAPMLESDTGMIDLPDEDTQEEPIEPEETKVEEVFFGETGEIGEITKVDQMEDTTANLVMEALKAETLGTGDMTEVHVAINEMEQKTADVPREFKKVLAMEYDGQMSLIVPDSEQVEKQITGQISLDEVLFEWEKMKKESEEKRKEAVRQRVLEQTGTMFTEFEASVRDGLLEQLEKNKNNSAAITPVEEDLSLLEETEELSEKEELYENEEGEGENLGENEEFEDQELTESEGSEAEDLGESEELEEEEFAESEGSEAEDLGESEELEEEGFAESEGSEAEDLDKSEELEEEEFAESEGSEEEDLAESEELEEEEPTENEEAGEEDLGEVEELAEVDDMIVEENAEPDEMALEQTLRAEAEEATGKDTRKKTTKTFTTNGRDFTPEEEEMFDQFIQDETSRAQITHAIDTVTLASYTGNVIITGVEGTDTLTLAKNLIKEVQISDNNFSGKIAKISGNALNKKDIEETLQKLSNGALIIQKASGMTKETANKLHKALQHENQGIVLVMADTKKAMNRLEEENPFIHESFSIRVDVEALSNEVLVEFGKKYALEQEFNIDDLGVLALHTKIADRQTSDHVVTISEVRELVEEAIYHASKKSIGHFFDVVFGKRYDEDDMIILREKDFV